MRWTVALALAVALAPCARAHAQMVDDDVDGVDDAIDECLDTPPADLVDAVGCSVCDCLTAPDGEDWPSHEAYVRCVTQEVRSRRAARALTRKAGRDAMKHARLSTCGGDEDLTRCCVYAGESSAGRCRIMPWDACDADELGTFDAWDEDVGSCLPNPCE